MSSELQDPSLAERRLHPRTSIRVQVRVEHTELSFSAETANISAGGVFLITEKRLPPGTRLRLRLHVLLLTKYPIQAEGEVVRQEDEPRGLAVRFLRISDEDQALLADLAERPDPSRAD